MVGTERTIVRAFFAWRHARIVQLIAIAVLAAIVGVRLGLMTYWSRADAEYSTSGSRLLIAWILGLIVLAMLSLFGWQIWTGRHKGGDGDAES